MEVRRLIVNCFFVSSQVLWQSLHADGSTRQVIIRPRFCSHTFSFLAQCNPELSKLISRTLKVDKSIWLKNLSMLEKLLPYAEDEAFRNEWAAIKQRNKERLAHHVEVTLGFTVNTNAMFDVQIKVTYSCNAFVVHY